MECIDAQTSIASYVEGNLSESELKKFLDHMQNCENCMEELEIYYTLMEATRQLDEGVITTSNFLEELNQKILNDLKTIKENEDSKERFRFFFVILIILVIIWLVTIL